MRALMTVCVFVVAAVSARAEEPALVVERAIRATGGEAAVAKTRVMTQTAKGRVNMNRTETDAEWAMKWNLPDQLRWELTINQASGRTQTVIVLNGTRGWQSVNGGPAADLESIPFAVVTDEAHVYWLCRLEPLKHKDVRLTPLPDETVDSQPANAIKAAYPGKPDVKLSFSKSSGLLLKAAFQSTGGVAKEFQFAEPKDFDGVRLPTRLTHVENGVRMGQWTVTRYQFVNKIDPADFKKP